MQWTKCSASFGMGRSPEMSRVPRRLALHLDARRSTDLSGDTAASGNLKIDGARKSILLKGVQITVDGRTFTTERAIASPPRFKMDTIEVVPTSLWKSLHTTAPPN
jgi:hypothetical protein